MPSLVRGLAALLAGGATGAGEGLRSTYRLQQGDEDRALRERQFAESQRQFDVGQERLREERETSLDQLPADLRSHLGGTGPTVRTNLLGPILNFRQNQQKVASVTGESVSTWFWFRS